jgi:eukaryotic-like serine/threonine-protein kinase
VPIELERIIARSLARDAEKRYRTARDLGRDLISFLYKNGRAVSPYDIAELVRGAMAVRKKAQPTDRGLAIEKLIEEALLEFTSLQQGDQPAPAAHKAPASTGFENISDWTKDLLNPGPTHDSASAGAAGPEVEAGNLAALEEDDDPVAPRTSGLAELEASPTPAAADARAPSVKPPAPKKAAPVEVKEAGERGQKAIVTAEDGDLSTGKAGGGGGGTVKALLVVVALAILAAGAYFGGLFK